MALFICSKQTKETQNENQIVLTKYKLNKTGTIGINQHSVAFIEPLLAWKSNNY